VRTYIHNFDLKLTLLIQQWRGLEMPMTIFTTLGHPVTTMGVGLLIIFVGWFRTNARLAYAGMGVFVMLGIGSLLKLLLKRDRPLTEYVNNMMFTSFSFPSGHTVGSTVAYGLLAYLAWHMVPGPWNMIVAGLLIVLIVMVGISRVYLGAHFPSDVVAGWLLGLLGLLLIILIIKPTV